VIIDRLEPISKRKETLTRYNPTVTTLESLT
jgi:hypothetical protein